jgi:hypothetical protein
MKRSTVLTEKNRATWATAFAVIILLPVAWSLVGFVVPQARAVPEGVFLEPADSPREECVLEGDSIEWRYRHMDLLKDLREDVIRRGNPGDVDVTLAGCGDCHVNRVLFCDRCHDAASVNLDCFHCHFYPDTDEERQERLLQAAREGR